MKITPIKTSFNAGIFSAKMAGRVDIEKYASACSEMTNFMPLVQGATIKRPGTKYVGAVKDSTQRVWLATFTFDFQQSFILEFGVGYIRFYNNYGRLADSSLAWDSSTAYNVGDTATRGGATYYAKVATTNNPPPNSPVWYPITSGIYEVPTSYTSDDLTTTDGVFGLSMVQSADVIYIATRGHLPRKLSRFSNTRWTLTDINSDKLPFQINNADENKVVTINGLTTFNGIPFAPYDVTFSVDSSITLPAIGTTMQFTVVDDAIIKPWAGQLGTDDTTSVGDIRKNDGKYYICNQSIDGQQSWYVSPIHTKGGQWDGDEVSWWYMADVNGVVRVTGTNTGTVIRQVAPVTTSTSNSTWAYSYSAWNPTDGYPTHVTFFRDRLVFGRDQQIWFSVSADYENFSAEEFGQVLDDSAITVTVPFEQVSQIGYMSPIKQGLIVGSSDGEAIIQQGSAGQPFSPTNISISITTRYGCRAIQPAKVDDALMYLQRAGRKLRVAAYDAYTDNMVADDVTVMADDVTSSGVLDFSFQREPFNILWCACTDGSIAAFTYNKKQDVTGWHVHNLGGNGLIQSVKVIPSFDGTRDDLWLVVKRTINGSIVQTVEYMTREYDSNTMEQEDSYFVDCGSVYSGTPTTTVTGMTWLPHTTLKVLVDGAVHPDVTTDGSGTFTLNYPGSVVQAGLGYTSIVATMRLEGGSQQGTAQGKQKKLSEITTRVYNTADLQIGTGEGTYPYVPMDLRGTNTPMGTPEQLISGDITTVMDCPITTDCVIKIKSDTPLPATILMIAPLVEVYDK